MPISKRCNFCHKRLDIGEKCSCRSVKRHKQKKTDEVYIESHWLKLREKCISNCFGIDVFAYYNDNQIRFGFTVHHIYPVEKFPELAYELDNLIYLTEQNHRIVHNMMKRDFEGTVKMLKEYRRRFESEFGIGGRQKCF